MIRPSRATRVALVVSASAVAFTAAFLLARFGTLPLLLPVRFRPNGRPIGWQFKTYARVMTPVFVQIALTAVFGAIGALLLSRREAGTAIDGGAASADMKAASAAAEGVVLIMTIWVVFQAYAGLALAAMWQRQFGDLGRSYNALELAGVVLTVIAAARTELRLGRPDARPFVAEHWRLGRLYRNPSDPALFVPTRDGSRWTLNFGRPVAAALMAVVLLVGLVAPTAILVLLFR